MLVIINQISRYWIGVVFVFYVYIVVEGGFVQLCYGKVVLLCLMFFGDWLIYYFLCIDMLIGKLFQVFIVIGQVKDSLVYKYQMMELFVFFCWDICYVLCWEVKIVFLLNEFDFICGN